MVDPPGANVQPALSQKYFAVYSQNDWRPTTKLTVNLGLRWELQPGPTERFNRMSAWDFRPERVRHQGAIAFPGVDGYSRNLWDTTYDNWGPRVGAAYSLNDRPSFAAASGSPICRATPAIFRTDGLRLGQLLGGRHPDGVRHDAARRAGDPFSDPAPIAPAIGGDPTAPQVYGIGEARFDRHFKNGQARQWNFFIERSLFPNWMASIGYTASVSRNCSNRSFPIQNLQSIPVETLAQWRDQYIASNGTLNPATQLVPNPFQPSSGPLLPFAGRAGCGDDRAAEHALPVSATDWVERGRGSQRSDGRLPRDGPPRQPPVLGRRHDGRDLHVVQGDRQHRQHGGQPELQRRRRRARQQSQPHRSDAQSTAWLQRVPHRLVGTFLYDLPFGKGQALEAPSAWLRAIAAAGSSAARWSGRPASRLPSPARAMARRRPVRIASTARRSCCPRTCGVGTTDGRSRSRADA